MTTTRFKLRIGIIIAVGLLLAAAAAVYLPRESLASAQAAPGQAEADEVWFCPMHAHVTSDHEGSCPICGMKLVKRTSASTKLPAGMGSHMQEESHEKMHQDVHGETHSGAEPEAPAGEPPEAHMNSRAGMKHEAHVESHASHEAHAPMQDDAVFVPPPMQSRLGVVTESIEPIDFSPVIPVTALAVADERRAISSSPKVEGWIRRLAISVVGQRVHVGDVLYEIYSPELQQRQRDYIDLLTRRDSLLEARRASGGMQVGNSSPDLMLASVARERYRARARLIAADVPLAVLQDIERFRRVHDVVAVLAEHEGIVTTVDAREGSYVRPGEAVLSYSDPRARWAEISLNPESLGEVDNGAVVELRPDFGRMHTISVPLNSRAATVDPVTRQVRLRVRIPDGAADILPGTLLDGRIVMKPRRAFTVPVDTVLRTGAGDFVVLAEASNHFTKAPVRLGAEAGDRVEVLEGLTAGQRVVTNGQFLLSAESSFRSSWRRLTADTADPVGQGALQAAAVMQASHEHPLH